MTNPDIRTTSAFYATLNNKSQVSSILNGIDPKYLNPNSRFGKAFYVSEDAETALAEMKHYGIQPTHVIRFLMNHSAMSVLDLTEPDVAAKYDYVGGAISSVTQAIGAAARRDGYNVVHFHSERAAGKSNHAILEDYNQILKPQIVTPVEK